MSDQNSAVANANVASSIIDETMQAQVDAAIQKMIEDRARREGLLDSTEVNTSVSTETDDANEDVISEELLPYKRFLSKRMKARIKACKLDKRKDKAILEELALIEDKKERAKARREATKAKRQRYMAATLAGLRNLKGPFYCRPSHKNPHLLVIGGIGSWHPITVTKGAWNRISANIAQIDAVTSQLPEPPTDK